MKFTREDLRLYGVTDRYWLKGARLVEHAELALKGGVSFLQVREKKLGREEFLVEAKELKQLCVRYRVPFIVNDDVEIAIEADADGVHVGQHDMVAQDVREKIGESKILGVSAQTVEQALLAEKMGADYLGVGAVFPTGTKHDADWVSLEELRNICEAVRIPVVAIGGITEVNVGQLKGSGICGVAVVSAIFGAKEIEAAARAVRRCIDGVLGTCQN